MVSKIRMSTQVNVDADINHNSHKITNLADGTALTDAVTLQQLNNATIGLLDLRGSYDASANAFPTTGGSGTAGAILKGDTWFISVGGTLGSTTVSAGDSIYARIDSPSTTEANWDFIKSGSSLGYTAENTANKVTSISSGSTDTQYASAKLLYTQLGLKADASALSAKLAITNYVCRESVAGTKNGSNTSFTLANTPTSGTEMIFVNGVLMNAGSGNDYTITGSTVAFTTAPISSDIILATYWK